MLERKRLAYGEGISERAGRPKVMKSLVFSATFLSVMCSCAPTTVAVPRRDPVVEEARRAQARPPAVERTCRMNGRTLEYSSGGRTVRLVNILEADERPAGLACRGERAYVLSDRSLIIVRPGSPGPDLDGDGISLVASYSRTDMQGILAPGLVSWTQSDDTTYFLTRDGSLTLVPVEDMGNTIPSFSVPYDVGGASIIHHAGYLFLATLSGTMVVISGSESRAIPFRTSVGNPGFFMSGGALVFGRKGVEENEIRIGEGIDQVSVVRR